MAKQKLFQSSIGKKMLMALTGLFLILFLVAHLVGNLQLLKNDNGESFNLYASFMAHNPLIKILSIVTYLGILAHVIMAVKLTIANKKARPTAYAVSNVKGATFASKNMYALGVIVLVFIVVHLQNFWYHMKFGVTPTTTINGETYKDLYTMVKEAFQELWIVALYVVAMIGLALHLAHGFQSAFQTLGLNHKKYTPIIKKIGLAFSILVPLLFAILPIYFFINSL